MDRKEERALVKETKALIKEVEAGDTDRAAWIAIQDRVQQLKQDRSQEEVGKKLGKVRSWVSDVLRWDRRGPRQTPFAGSEETRPTTRAQRGAKEVLGDPEQRSKTFKGLSPAQLAAIEADAGEERAAKVKARKSEHRKDKTAGKLTDTTSQQEAETELTESWADDAFIRATHRVNDLARHQKKWGLVLQSMTDPEALEKVEKAERQLANIRAELQERVRDHNGVPVS